MLRKSYEKDRCAGKTGKGQLLWVRGKRGLPRLYSVPSETVRPHAARFNPMSNKIIRPAVLFSLCLTLHMGWSGSATAIPAVPLPTGCVTASAANGAWTLANCAGTYESVQFAQPASPSIGSPASNDEKFPLFPNQTHSAGDSRYGYKAWACTEGLPIDLDTRAAPTFRSSRVGCS